MQEDLAHAVKIVFLVMAGAMAVAAIVALVGLRRGRQEAVDGEPAPAPTSG